jgi:CheY-like chemotaxis protein
MNPSLATDWVQVLVGPAWEALLVVLVAAGAVTFAARRPLVVQKLAADAGISRISLLGIEVELAAAFEARRQPPPQATTLHAFKILSARLEPLVRGRGVVWIDDKPDGNRHEVELLRKLGVQVDQVRSTARALARLREPSMPIDVVIANWTRADAVAGADVVAALRDAGYAVPVMFYVGDASPERKAAAAAAGAVGLTNAPDELLKLALVELATAGP